MTDEDKNRGRKFTLTRWRVVPDEPAIEFEFECDRHGAFCEKVSFPPLKQPLAQNLPAEFCALIDLLHIALGVSYYKCAAAQELILPDVGAAGKAMAVSLYTEGLAEFFVRAGLSYPAETRFITTAPMENRSGALLMPAPTDLPFGPDSLIAFGGGKDSYVARAIVIATNQSYQLCSVTLSERVEAVLQQTAPEPLVFLHRQLDPKLRELNRADAFNGHVPITAINSLILVIYGRLIGAKQVIFANERSADEPTMNIDGVIANHQHSKSGAFEQLLRAAIIAADTAAPDYFSILRPYSELWIAKAMASLKTPFDRFTSCNRNFQIVAGKTQRWCGDCAKCAFTSLLLAPYSSAAEMARIFPQNFLNSKALLPLYRELCGLTQTKPWDCVGTIDECRASLHQLTKSSDWRENLAVKTLAPQIYKFVPPEELEQIWRDAMTPTQPHNVPPNLMKASHDLIH